jgi:hypothetical protein
MDETVLCEHHSQRTVEFRGVVDQHYPGARRNHPDIIQGIMAKKPISASSPCFETMEMITILNAVTK